MTLLQHDGQHVLVYGNITPGVQVGPHEFGPLGWRDKRGLHGRCGACYLPRALHPVLVYSPARPYGDKRQAGVLVSDDDVAAATDKALLGLHHG